MSLFPGVIWDWALAEATARGCEQQAQLLEQTAAELRRQLRSWDQHWRGPAHRSAEQTALRHLRDGERLAEEWRHCAQLLRAASARARAEQLRRAALTAGNQRGRP